MLNSFENYNFFLNLIFPENENFKLKNVELYKNIKNFAPIENFIIFPVKYIQINSSTLFLLFHKNLFEKVFEIINDYIYPHLISSSKNLTNINFKKVDLKIEQSVNYRVIYENIPDELLLLNYEILNLCEFYFLIPFIFIKNFIKFFIGSAIEFSKITNITNAINYFKFRLYYDNITSFWDVTDFINTLSDKEVQRLINILLSNNIIEESMLTALTAGFYIKFNNKEKILRNISKNLRQEIEKNILISFPSYRWIEEACYLIKDGIKELILEDKIDFTSLKYIQNLKEKLREEFYKKFFENKNFDQWIIEAEKNNVLDNLKILTPNKILTRALANSKIEIIDLLTENLTKDGKKLFYEDIEYERKNCSINEIFKSQIIVIENLKDIYYDEIASKKIEEFEEIISSLNKIDLNFLINQTGVLKFAQATIRATKKFKNYICSMLSGIPKNLLIDIYTGKVRFKSSFGEITINKFKQEILKIYFFLKNEGKFYEIE
jgi:hypothetical protein